MADLALFDVDVPETVPAGGEGLSAGRRLTQRQAALLAGGRHPLSTITAHPLLLHPDAAPARDRSAPGLRCRGCRFRVVVGHHSRSYPKCLYGLTEGFHTSCAPRFSNGAASDCRAWWPACRDYQEREA